MNITALGDIISILKHAKGATAKKAADKVLHSDSDTAGKQPTDIPKTHHTTTGELKASTSRKKTENTKIESFVMSSRLGLQIPESDSDPPSPAMDTGKSVFSRLGDQQSDDSEVETKKVKTKVKDTSPGSSKRLASGSIFERLGPESDRGDREPSPQEARVTSTTSTQESLAQQPAKGQSNVK